MAAYVGARRLDGIAGRRTAPATARGRAVPARGRTSDTPGAASRVIQRARPSSVGIALAAIVIVFSAAFLSLSQSVRVAATGYDIVRLQSEHDRLTAIKQDLTSDVERLRGEPAIRKQALDAGLGQLGAPLSIPAR